MANRKDRGRPQGGDRDQYHDEYYTDGYYDGGYDDGQDYYDDGGQYADDQGYYDDGGYYSGGSYYDHGGYSEPYYDDRPSMASRAADGQNRDPYGLNRRGTGRQARQPARRAARYESYGGSAPRRRRRKRHGFRNVLIFLLLLFAIAAALYLLLFRAPEQYTDYLHTRKSGVYNILIAATDEEEARTDTMMIATLDLEQGQIALTSLPRDTIVDNGEWVPKLNGVYGLAGGGEDGAEALMDQVKTLLGFRPDGYAVINYEVFRDAVDALGGVTFDVPMEMEVDNPPNYDEIIHLYPGVQELNGDQALAVCRYRYGYLMADIQRQYVQQSFLKALISEALSPAKWLRLPAVYQAVMDNTLTDLSGANLRWLALQALRCGTDDIPQNTLPGEGVSYNGASCYGLYGLSVVDMVNEVMNPYEEDITLDDVYILTVSEGYLVESTWRGVAFDAGSYDYDSY